MPTSDIFYVKKRKDNPKENLEKKNKKIWGTVCLEFWGDGGLETKDNLMLWYIIVHPHPTKYILTYV